MSAAQLTPAAPGVERPGPLANAATGGYDFVQCVPNQDVIVARMSLRSSEVNALRRRLDPQGLSRASALFVFADTLVHDEQFIHASFVTIVTRVLDVESHRESMKFMLPAAEAAALDLLTMQVRGHQLLVQAEGRQSWAALVSSTFNRAGKPQAISYYASGTLLEHDVSTDPGRIIEVAKNPHVWNLLKGQFALACEYLDQPARREEGRALLSWIVQCTQPLAAEPSPTAAEACQLNYQAAALLLMNNGSQAARYVPVWSETYLNTRIDELLFVLKGYEDKILGLEIRGDVQQTVESMTAALREVAQADEDALAASAELNEQELQAHWKQYHDLLWAYELQGHSVRLAFHTFKGGLDTAATFKVLGAVLEIVNLAGQMAGAYFGVGVPDPRAAGDAAKKAGEQGAEVAAKSLSLNQQILDAAKVLVVTEVMKIKAKMERIAKIAAAAAKIAEQSQEIKKATGMEARGTVDLPDLGEMSALDAEADWNVFIASVEVNLREFINGTDKNPAISGAKEYYLSLVTQAEYGKALTLTTVALGRLQARALEIEAQRHAARFAVQRWEQLRTEAKTMEEQLSLCKSLLLEAALNTKRSLLVMAEGYRAAYAYNNLHEQPMRLSLSMDYNKMNEQFRSIKRDIDQFFLTPRVAQEVLTDYFDIPVVQPGATPPAALHAVLTPASGGKQQLTWSTPLSAPPFDTWLSAGQRSAYFIQEAWFYLEGARPGPKGVVSLRVATTGQYENGYGSGAATQFISQGFALNFGYKPGDAAPYTSWRPAGRRKDNYMSPSPFTGWVATVDPGVDLSGLRSIRMKLALLRQDV